MVLGEKWSYASPVICIFIILKTLISINFLTFQDHIRHPLQRQMKLLLKRIQFHLNHTVRRRMYATGTLCVCTIIEKR